MTSISSDRVRKYLWISGTDKSLWNKIFRGLDSELENSHLSNELFAILLAHCHQMLYDVAYGLGVTIGDIRRMQFKEELTTLLFVKAFDDTEEKFDKEWASDQPRALWYAAFGFFNKHKMDDKEESDA